MRAYLRTGLAIPVAVARNKTIDSHSRLIA